MNTITNSTIKSVSASIGLHVLFIVLASWVFYNNTIQTLELTGNSGGGKRSISLDGINFVGKKHRASTTTNKTSKINQKVVTTSSLAKVSSSAKTDTVTTTNSAVESVVGDGQQGAVGSIAGSGSGSGTGTGDFDHGYLFGQIKNFFESRLGSTLNIRENQ